MRRRILAFGLPVVLALPAVHLGTAGAEARPVEFSDARLKVEINATDGDAGLQIFLDGEAWNEVELFDPDGNAIGRRRHRSGEGLRPHRAVLREQRATLRGVPARQFKQLFPEGTYTFRGTTVDGAPITASATLTHDFPDGPDDPLAGGRLAGAAGPCCGGVDAGHHTSRN